MAESGWGQNRASETVRGYITHQEKNYVFLLVTVLAVVILFFAITTKAAEYYPNYLDPQNVIYKPVIESNQRLGNRNLSFHPIRASKTISEDSLRGFLELKSSPLAPFAGRIVQSEYWSTIIAITNAEQSFSKRPVSSPNNLYGLMSHGKLIQFPTIEAGIEAEDAFLRRADGNNKSTIESLNCWYVQPCSPNWLNTVLKTKDLVEALPN